MTHLQNLPTELLERILSFLSEPDNHLLKRGHRCTATKDLYNLCLVSQTLRLHAQPLLFRYLDCGIIDSDLEELVLFIKAIHIRPELGQHVKFASLLASLPVLPKERSQELCESLQFLQDPIRDFKLGDDEKNWMTALEKLDISVLVALLTSKTPNLRALRVLEGEFHIDPLIQLWKRDSSFLSSLEQIWISCADVWGGYDMSVYAPMLSLPKMKAPTFEYAILLGTQFPASWVPNSLPAEEIVFEDCLIDTPAIQEFLRACRKVKSFIYKSFTLDMDAESLSGSDMPDFNAADLHAALSPHKQTLEHLHLEFFRGPWIIESIESYRDWCNAQTKIPSFRDFPALETVIIQHALVPPHPRFSPALQLLHITDCNSSLREVISNIAKDTKKGLYPNLTEFRVLAIDVTRPIKLPGQIVPPGATPADCFMSLQDMFKGTNVDFMINPYRIPHYGESDDSYGDDDGDGDSDEDGPLGPFPGPPGFESFLVQMALQNPNFAAMVRGAGGGGHDSDNSWVTDDED
ncbi:hypothetical protein BDW59DRAFT_138101 [Aspergillus cavernicola]|uniref:F-box domain-containing protein n=1 Tax=Aspergillus cavernicola TaxID=176166 RepID=A0ABR4J149_9EURO